MNTVDWIDNNLINQIIMQLLSQVYATLQRMFMFSYVLYVDR